MDKNTTHTTSPTKKKRQDTKIQDLDKSLNKDLDKKKPKKAKSTTSKTTKKKEELQAQVAVWKEKYLRLYAEFENFRRRSSKERSDWAHMANKELILACLPVLDDLERAQASFLATQNPEALSKGLELIHHKFLHILKEQHLEVIESNKGDVFDLEKHEAISQIPSPSPELKGKIVDVIEKGYALKGHMIRYAKVVTAHHE